MISTVMTQEQTLSPPPAEKKSKKRGIALIIHRFIERNRMNVGLAVSLILQLLLLFFWYVPEVIIKEKPKKVLEDLAFVDVNLQTPTTSAPEIPDDGEIELTDKKIIKKEKKPDPRISGAQDAVFSGATTPVDLSPGVRPDYTSEARQNGITGTITLELIIADTGEVLRVRSVGKKLGYGLEESAIRTYRKKKYSPSMLNGKPITVKVLVPIRFTLN